jgi:hypothetical protein
MADWVYTVTPRKLREKDVLLFTREPFVPGGGGNRKDRECAAKSPVPGAVYF